MCFYLYRSAKLSNRRFGIIKIQNYKTLAEYFIEGLSSRKQFDSKCNKFCGACCLVRNYVDSESMKVVRQFSMQK